MKIVAVTSCPTAVSHPLITPFAAKAPLGVILALALGSATAGTISMVSGVQLLVSHGGIFAAANPRAVIHLDAYLLAIVVVSAVTPGVLLFLKRPLALQEEPPTGKEPLASA